MPNENHRRVVITRPLGQGQSLAAEFAAKGITVDHYPLIQIRAKEVAPSRLGAWVIFISPNAVRYASELNWLSPLSSTLSNKQVVAVGNATAEALHKLGVSQVITPAHPSSEGLIQSLSKHNFTDVQVSIVCGEKGREMIQNWLSEQGALINRIEVYTREPITAPIQANANQLWIVSSSVAIDALQPKVAAAPLDLVVTSERLRNYALERGFKVAFCTSSADNRQIANEVTHFLTDPNL